MSKKLKPTPKKAIRQKSPRKISQQLRGAKCAGASADHTSIIPNLRYLNEISDALPLDKLLPISVGIFEKARDFLAVPLGRDGKPIEGFKLFLDDIAEFCARSGKWNGVDESTTDTRYQRAADIIVNTDAMSEKNIEAMSLDLLSFEMNPEDMRVFDMAFHGAISAYMNWVVEHNRKFLAQFSETPEIPQPSSGNVGFDDTDWNTWPDYPEEEDEDDKAEASDPTLQSHAAPPMSAAAEKAIKAHFVAFGLDMDNDESWQRAFWGMMRRFAEGSSTDDDRRFVVGTVEILDPELEAAGFMDAPPQPIEMASAEQPSRTTALENWHQRVSATVSTARQRLHALEFEEGLSRHLLEGLEAGHEVTAHIAAMEKAIAILSREDDA